VFEKLIRSRAREAIRFDDGTSWDLNTIKTQVPQGTSGADNLYAYAPGDTLHGLAGNDTLYGAAGADQLSGDDGNDSLLGAAGNDSLDGEPAMISYRV
jgi:Ca2+-binding RTX toxin-like protein